MRYSLLAKLTVTILSLVLISCGGEIISASKVSAEDPIEAPTALELSVEHQRAVADALSALNDASPNKIAKLSIVEPAAFAFGGVGGGFVHIDARVYAEFADGTTFLSRDFALSGRQDKWPRENGWLTEAGLRDLIVDQIQRHLKKN